LKKKSVNSPDDIRIFDKGKVELTTFNEGSTIGRITLEPGWSCDKSLKSIANTNSCQAPPTRYLISGRMKVVMDDRTEEEFEPGDTSAIPPGNNAWVVGDELVVTIDFIELKNYTKRQ
jgi:mannose-6-phosphate isomerase-like protein (cupin superfamily)